MDDFILPLTRTKGDGGGLEEMVEEREGLGKGGGEGGRGEEGNCCCDNLLLTWQSKKVFFVCFTYFLIYFNFILCLIPAKEKKG